MGDFRGKVNRLLAASMSTFGEEVTHYPQAGGILKVHGVFDNSFELVDPDTSQVISANQPALGVNLNDFKTEVKVGDQFLIRGIRFKVVDKREDGQGGATLLLHKARANDKLRDLKTD